MQGKSSQWVTLKDVAKHAGVAIGTVDRVLNGTGFVSEKKRQQVQKAIEELGYVQNRVARAFSRQKRMEVAVIYPNIETFFWEQIEKGIAKAEEQYGPYGLVINRIQLKSYALEHQSSVLQNIINQPHIKGIALVPVHNSKLNSDITMLVQKGIPVVTFDSDAPLSGRACFVGEDNLRGGQLAGKLLALFMGGKGKVLVFRAQTDLLAIQQRITGFIEKIATEYPDIEIQNIYDMYDHEDNYNDIIYNMIKSIAEKMKEGLEHVDGIFVTNGLVEIVANAIEEICPDSKAKIVGFDYSEKIGKLINKGIISAVVCSDLESEGYQAIKTLYELIEHKKGPEDGKIIINYNIKIKETIV